MYVHAGIPRNTKREAIIHIPRGSKVKKKRQNELLTNIMRQRTPKNVNEFN